MNKMSEAGKFAARINNPDKPAQFVGSIFVASLLGLGLGALLDAAFAKAQGDNPPSYLDRDRSRAALFFVLQLLANIVILLAIIRAWPMFVPWFQLTLSGAIFAVLFFSVQNNLQTNVLRITAF